MITLGSASTSLGLPAPGSSSAPGVFNLDNFIGQGLHSNFILQNPGSGSGNSGDGGPTDGGGGNGCDPIYGCGGPTLTWNPPGMCDPVLGCHPSDPTTQPTTTPVSTGTTGASSSSGSSCSLWNPLSWAGDCLIRAVLLILGLLCIAGAIYLFKPTQDVIMAPVNAAKKVGNLAVKHAGAIAAATA